MYQVKSSENLEGMSPGGLINHGKKKNPRLRIPYINWVVKVFWSHTSSCIGEIRNEVFLQRTLACGTHYGIGMLCQTEAGEQQID